MALRSYINTQSFYCADEFAMSEIICNIYILLYLTYVMPEFYILCSYGFFYTLPTF
jgi:hypothetical protein